MDLVGLGALIAAITGALGFWGGRRRERREERKERRKDDAEIYTAETERIDMIWRRQDDMQKQLDECNRDRAELRTMVGELTGQIKAYGELLPTLRAEGGRRKEPPKSIIGGQRPYDVPPLES